MKLIHKHEAMGDILHSNHHRGFVPFYCQVMFHDMNLVSYNDYISSSSQQPHEVAASFITSYG